MRALSESAKTPWPITKLASIRIVFGGKKFEVPAEATSNLLLLCMKATAYLAESGGNLFFAMDGGDGACAYHMAFAYHACEFLWRHMRPANF